MKYSRLIAVLAASSMLATFSAHAYDKDGDVKYDKDGDGHHHHKKHHEPMKRFSFSGGATYLVPSMNGLDFATVANTTTIPSDTVNTYNLNPGYNWGYFLAAGYMISRHYDIQASWSQYNSDATDDIGAAGPDMILHTSNEATTGALAAGETANASSNEKLKTEAFDITLGQYHHIGRSMMARAFAGIGYAKIDSKTVNTYTSSVALGNGTDTYNSTFTGWGPKLGMDAEYRVWDRLDVIGHLAAAFLIGPQDTDSNLLENVSGGAGTFGQTSVDTGNDTRMVPAIDAKLGLGWDSLYNSDSWGLGIEGGYQVAYYFNAVDQVQYVGDSEIEHNFDSVGIMGPYLNLTVSF